MLRPKQELYLYPKVLRGLTVHNKICHLKKKKKFDGKEDFIEKRNKIGAYQNQ